MPTAVIDATAHTEAAGPHRTVAGLPLLERALRLAAINDCQAAVVAVEQVFADVVTDLVEAHDSALDVSVVVLESLEASDDRKGLDNLVALIDKETNAGDGAVLYFRSSTIYKRQLLSTCLPDLESPDLRPPDIHLVSAPTIAASPTSPGPDVDTSVFRTADIAWINQTGWEYVRNHWEREGLISPASLATPFLDGTGEHDLTVLVDELDDGWQLPVTGEETAQRAADRLWSDCRKPVDGIISRFINRNISLAISKRLADTSVHPNHISVVTFSLGILAALFAALGGYGWFLAAGLTYQLNSVIDGVDGELARVKYEFSFLGEWLDTVSDDTKDVLFYAGLGFGAWRMDIAAGVGDIGADLWIWLAAVAVGGKLLAMFAYYTWLIGRGTGDLLAFHWSFEDEPDGVRRDDGWRQTVANLLSKLKYLTKNDFIVFLAMWMAIVGALPWFLFVIAPGQLIVAGSVIVQRLQSK